MVTVERQRYGVLVITFNFNYIKLYLLYEINFINATNENLIAQRRAFDFLITLHLCN